MTSSTEQLPSALEHNRGTDGALGRPWYCELRLWLAVFITLVAKLVVIGLWLHVWKDRDWVGHVNADLWTWLDFFRASRAGGIPYVDFGREYPVLAGGLYWLLAQAVDVESQPDLFLAHAVLMASADLINAGLFYTIARDVNARFALPVTLVFSLSLTGLLLGPLRFDGFLVTSLLGGYRLHQRGRPQAATAVWSIGCALKWFPAFLIVIQELRAWYSGDRNWRWLRAALLFAAIQLAINGPPMLATWLKYGNLDQWLYTYNYHAGRQLSADTVLGVAELWRGALPWQTYAVYWSAALMIAAMVLRPTQPLPYKVVLVAIAAVLFNRIYSPQFNLWFYPFLALIVLESRQKRAIVLLFLLLVLDVINVQVYPFEFTRALNEIGKFRPNRAALKGGEATASFTMYVLLRFGVLLAIAGEVWRGREPPPLALTRIRSGLAAWASRHYATALSACVLIAYSLWARAATLGIARFADERYHVKQIHRFCRGKTELLGTLTVLPGYHAISAVFGELIDDCSPRVLRAFGMGWGLSAALLAFLLLGALGSQRRVLRTAAFFFLPILLPYQLVVYTDVAALVPALLAMYFVAERRWTAAAIAAIVGIFFRQSNAVVLLLVAGVAWLEHDKQGRLRDWLVAYLKQTWCAWLGLLGFAAFVIVNGGVAVGDRDRHALGFHLDNVWFALALLCALQLPIAFESLWQARHRLRPLIVALTLIAAYALYMLTFRVEHEFNTHQDFLRNQFLHWVVQDPRRKTLFFIPIAIGALSIWAIGFSRPAHWLLLPVALTTLLPDGLVEQRYAILPIGSWMLLRLDASPAAEVAALAINIALSTWLVLQIAGGAQL